MIFHKTFRLPLRYTSCQPLCSVIANLYWVYWTLSLTSSYDWPRWPLRNRLLIQPPKLAAFPIKPSLTPKKTSLISHIVAIQRGSSSSTLDQQLFDAVRSRARLFTRRRSINGTSHGESVEKKRREQLVCCLRVERLLRKKLWLQNQCLRENWISHAADDDDDEWIISSWKNICTHVTKSWVVSRGKHWKIAEQWDMSSSEI